MNTTTTTTLTARELDQIAQANASARPAAVLIHGLWLLAGSWDAWRDHLEDAGYAVVAAEWPQEPANVADARTNPGSFAGVGVQEVTDHIAEIASALHRRPVVIGHSFGGLLAQRIADLGLAAATVAIDPAPFKGVLPLPASTLKAASPVLGNPANRKRTVTLSFDEFRYGFANSVEEDEAHDLYDTFHVAAPGRPLFQAATANFTRGTATRVDTRNPARGPLLVISGERDNIVPRAVSHAAYRLQSRNEAATEFVEIPGRGHSLVIDSGWRTVADTALEFAARHDGNGTAA
ncbi:alpha/beta hydrolase [Demequina capsici]|uniref:Alpha/beta fold hydrolase n=1 Tax=Demequina capsici TaxID=3075620 RepID=A0AA96F9L3_9MICO|nr:alpha/beta fold hydrolase [Demequina sp. OYTSA14]WNM25255.1 alpha/beta fold hydrolase [Demequina sp. OYTSA14]